MTKPTVKAVFFDIDGTLLSFKTHLVPASTESAIAQLKAKGIKVIISTGRSFQSIDQIKYLEFDGYITYNGGYCVSKEGEVLFRKTMDERDILNVIAYGKENPLSYAFMSEHEIAMSNATEEIIGMYRSLNLPPPQVIDYDKVDINGVYQANIFIGPEQEEDFMSKVMPNSVASRWTDIFADTNPKGQSKRVGLDVFCQHFGIDISQTMAFGDGGNDIEMLKYAHIGVAMGNAGENVKAIADYVTSAVDEDGVANALKHFEVID